MSQGSPVANQLSTDHIGLDTQEGIKPPFMTGTNLKLTSVNCKTESNLEAIELEERSSPQDKATPDNLLNGVHGAHISDTPLPTQCKSEDYDINYSQSQSVMDSDTTQIPPSANDPMTSEKCGMNVDSVSANGDADEISPDDPLCALYQSRLEQVQNLRRDLKELNEKKALKMARIAEAKLEFERLKQVFYHQLATSDSLARDLQRQNMELRCLSREECVRQVSHLSMDVATNLTFTRLRQECKEKRSRLQQVCDNLQGFKYTPDSAEARVLRLRLKHLLDENKRLGAQSGSLRVEQLSSKTTMLRRLNEEHRRCTQLTAQAYDDSLEDMVGLQSTVLLLEKHLLNSEAVKRALISRLEKHSPDLVNSILSKDRPLVMPPSDNDAEESKVISHHPNEEPMDLQEGSSSMEKVSEVVSGDTSWGVYSSSQSQIQAAPAPSPSAGENASDSNAVHKPSYPNVSTPPSMNISLKDNVPSRTS